MLNPEQTETFAPLLREVYRTINRQMSVPSEQRAEQSVWVGVTANYVAAGSAVALPYTRGIEEAGGIPFIIPITDNVEVLRRYLERVDALVLTGGGDGDPAYYGQNPSIGLGEVTPLRDSYEHLLLGLALQMNIPVLGICRGMQIINVALGGSLFQDLYSSDSNKERLINHAPPIPKEYPCHDISIEKNSVLGRLLLPLYSCSEKVRVNSLHHQAVDRVALGLTVTAQSPDGVIEALELYPHKPVLGVQWHPEQLVAGQEPRHKVLFEHIVSEGRLYRQARSLHEVFLTVDSHVDTPMKLRLKPCSLVDKGDALVDYTKMTEGGIDVVFMVAYLPQEANEEEGYCQSNDLLYSTLQEIYSQVDQAPKHFAVCRTSEQMRQAKKKGLKGIVPAIENAYPLGKDLSQLDRLQKDFGVAYITLCHNGDNQFCDSARKSCQTHGGLSPLGGQLVDELQRLGIMIDVSHASASTVEQVLDRVKVPIIASHSSAYTICAHERNLSDELIRRIAERGGVVQVCLYAGFISSDESEASVQRAADHIDHIVSVAGIDAVGIGSDFDGDGMLLGCAGSNDLINLTVELLRRGYVAEQVQKIWGENLLRVMDRVQHFAQENRNK